MGALAVRAVESGPVLYLSPFAVVGGLLFADLVSGMVHWLCDTWFKTDAPVVGTLFLRSFREHHVDPKAITRHDFIEANGNNFALSGLVTTAALVFGSNATTFGAFASMVALAAAVFVAMTSQIHKWAHTDTPPRMVRFFQSIGLFLSPAHHAVHHTAPHHRHYCITVGLLDGLFERVGFFRHLETLVKRVTGLAPREEDGAFTAIVSEPAPASFLSDAITLPMPEPIAAEALAEMPVDPDMPTLRVRTVRRMPPMARPEYDYLGRLDVHLAITRRAA
jgi:ubiquitin-conjugating enzyme E2 variant